MVDGNGHPLSVPVDLPGRRVDVGAWRIDVGRVPLLLLDTDLPSNDPADRPITHILYVRGREMRLCQEIVLGIGGVRLIEALGWEPSMWHVNEGHAALSLLERLSRRRSGGESHETAVKHIRRQTIFTLHTPIPAGNEAFDQHMVRRYLGGRLPGVEEETVVALGDSGRDGVFDLGAVAIRLSSTTNGVSRRHGEVVTRDWERIIGGPGRAVTNGVHLGTWVGPQMARNFEVALGDAWSENALRPEAWAAIYQIDDQDLWRAHQAQKDRLIRHLRRRMRDQRARHGESPEDLRRITTLLPADRLTITFARRFATYKRAGLLLSDVERLGRVLTHPERPIQIVFAGKAHPADREGQSLIRQVVEMAGGADLHGHLVFIEDYDMDLARFLVAGSDVWLNTPRPPMEASGTSGMKAAANGGLNLSVLDGWWVEGFTGSNGWAFGEPHESDQADAETLYDLLEHEVAPRFYERDTDGVPHPWVAMMKSAIVGAAAPFSAQRMVAQYVNELYSKTSSPTTVGGENHRRRTTDR